MRGTVITPRRLWFGLAASAVAWGTLGFSDILITWRACVHQEQYGNSSAHPGARAIYIILAVVLFLVVVVRRDDVYRNWRAISEQREIIDATANDRREFMALLGVFVSITMGMGVLWLAIPPLVIRALLEGEMKCFLSIAAMFSLLLFAGCFGGQTPRPYAVAVSGNAQHGRELIEGYGCGSCHTIPGVHDAKGLVGPPLIYFSRRTMIAGELPNTPGKPGRGSSIHGRSNRKRLCRTWGSTTTRLMTLQRTFTRCAELRGHDASRGHDEKHDIEWLPCWVFLRSGLAAAAQAPPAGSTNDVPGALPGIQLVSPVANGQWTMPAGDYGNTRYSPLNQINATNVQNLHIVATTSTGIPHGHEGGPLVVGTTLYAVTPFPNNLIALDLTQPAFHKNGFSSRIPIPNRRGWPAAMSSIAARVMRTARSFTTRSTTTRLRSMRTPANWFGRPKSVRSMRARRRPARRSLSRTSYWSVTPAANSACADD